MVILSSINYTNRQGTFIKTDFEAINGRIIKFPKTGEISIGIDRAHWARDTSYLKGKKMELKSLEKLEFKEHIDEISRFSNRF